MRELTRNILETRFPRLDERVLRSIEACEDLPTLKDAATRALTILAPEDLGL